MNNIKQEIITDINAAEKSIKIAVSWLSDFDLINTLLKSKQANENLKIEIIISDHNDNREQNVKEKLKELLKQGCEIYTWGSKNPQDGNFMHCKFYIIDDKFAKSGSYNWSYNAQRNAECLDEVEVSKKITFFKRLMDKRSTYLII